MLSPASFSPSFKLLDVCVGRAGFKRGPKLASVILEWQAAAAKAGRPISVEELPALAGISRATAYRRLQLFRELMPEKDTPNDLLVWPET